MLQTVAAIFRIWLQMARINILAAKYFLRDGDNWADAKSFATRIVKGFR